MDTTVIIFFIVGFLCALGYVGNEMFRRTRIPDVLLLMAVGVFIRWQWPNLDPSGPDLADLTNVFGTLAMVFILFDGGLELDFDVMLTQAGAALGLLVISLVSCVAGLSCAFHYILYWEWVPSLILATILGNISGAIVLPVVQQMSMPEKEKTLLKLEAAGSDVLVIVILLALVEVASKKYGPEVGSIDYLTVYKNLMSNFAVALFIGGIGGLIFVTVLDRIHGTPHYYIFTLGALLILYSIAHTSGASGPMAVLAFGVIISNANKFLTFINKGPATFTTHELRHLHSTFSFFVRTFFLIYVGLFLNDKLLDNIVLAIGLLSLVIVIITRLLAAQVFGFAAKKDKQARDTYFFMLPRGLAVAVLAILPLSNVQETWTKHFQNEKYQIPQAQQLALWDMLLKTPNKLQDPVWSLFTLTASEDDPIAYSTLELRQNIWEDFQKLDAQTRKAFWQDLACTPTHAQRVKKWKKILEGGTAVVSGEKPGVLQNANKKLTDKDFEALDKLRTMEDGNIFKLLITDPPLLPKSVVFEEGMKHIHNLRPFLQSKSGQVAGRFPLYAAFMILATNVFLTIGVFILERRPRTGGDDHGQDRLIDDSGGSPPATPPSEDDIPEAVAIPESPPRDTPDAPFAAPHSP